MKAQIELPREQPVAPFVFSGSGVLDRGLGARRVPRKGGSGMNREIQGGSVGFQPEAPRADDLVSTVNDQVGASRGRRWLVLVLTLAGIAGFVGSGGALTPARIVTVLLSLFVAVFLVALALSLLVEPIPTGPELLAEDEPKLRNVYAGEVAQVQHEAAFGSP